MDLWQDTNWFAVQTKPYQEKLATARATQLDLEVFLPQVRQPEMVCGATRWVIRPLFPGYFFARFSPRISFDAVRYTPGVVRVLGNDEGPIPVGWAIIAGIQERLEADGFIRLDAKAFARGQKVTINRGPFAGWMGRVESQRDGGARVLILLEAIQQARLLIEARLLAAAEMS